MLEISSCIVSHIHLIDKGDITLRDDYLAEAQKIITDPMILVNVVSRRAKQLKNGYKPLVESLERLSAEDMVYVKSWKVRSIPARRKR